MCNTNLRLAVLMVCVLMALGGCVERKLTINTDPQGAVVFLNDEEIGASPITVGFEWYGDYKVRAIREGYDILDTHRNLERPKHDKFPMDFFAEVLYPGRITDQYEWTLALTPYKAPYRDDLIRSAQELKDQAYQTQAARTAEQKP